MKQLYPLPPKRKRKNTGKILQRPLAKAPLPSEAFIKRAPRLWVENPQKTPTHTPTLQPETKNRHRRCGAQESGQAEADNESFHQYLLFASLPTMIQGDSHPPRVVLCPGDQSRLHCAMEGFDGAAREAWSPCKLIFPILSVSSLWAS